MASYWGPSKLTVVTAFPILPDWKQVAAITGTAGKATMDTDSSSEDEPIQLMGDNSRNTNHKKKTTDSVVETTEGDTADTLRKEHIKEFQSTIYTKLLKGSDGEIASYIAESMGVAATLGWEHQQQCEAVFERAKELATVTNSYINARSTPRKVHDSTTTNSSSRKKPHSAPATKVTFDPNPFEEQPQNEYPDFGEELRANWDSDGSNDDVLILDNVPKKQTTTPCNQPPKKKRKLEDKGRFTKFPEGNGTTPWIARYSGLDPRHRMTIYAGRINAKPAQDTIMAMMLADNSKYAKTLQNGGRIYSTKSILAGMSLHQQNFIKMFPKDPYNAAILSSAKIGNDPLSDLAKNIVTTATLSNTNPESATNSAKVFAPIGTKDIAFKLQFLYNQRSPVQHKDYARLMGRMAQFLDITAKGPSTEQERLTARSRMRGYMNQLHEIVEEMTNHHGQDLHITTLCNAALDVEKEKRSTFNERVDQAFTTILSDGLAKSTTLYHVLKDNGALKELNQLYIGASVEKSITARWRKKPAKQPKPKGQKPTKPKGQYQHQKGEGKPKRARKNRPNNKTVLCKWAAQGKDCPDRQGGLCTRAHSTDELIRTE